MRMGTEIDEERLVLTFQVLTPDEAATFLALLRVLLPHRQPELAGALNATALVLDSKLVTDLALRRDVLAGIGQLRSAAERAHGRAFAALTEAERAAIVGQAEDSMFFQTVLHLAKYDFYNRHLVWRVLGYPDLLNDSGYLDKGFDRLEI
jgi:hypothetical protein